MMRRVVGLAVAFALLPVMAMGQAGRPADTLADSAAAYVDAPGYVTRDRSRRSTP